MPPTSQILVMLLFGRSTCFSATNLSTLAENQQQLLVITLLTFPVYVPYHSDFMIAVLTPKLYSATQQLSGRVFSFLSKSIIR